ncbi:unnamed protein product [Camellia sinensis]
MLNIILWLYNENYSTTLGDVYGESTLLSLIDLHDSNKGFLVNDTLIVECKVIAISEVKNFDQSSLTLDSVFF